MSSKSDDVKVFPGDESKKFLLLQRTIDTASDVAFREDPPYDLNHDGNFALGVDVTKWHSLTVVHTCFDITALEADSTTVTFVPWRYYRTVTPMVAGVGGIAIPAEGAWIADVEETISLDSEGNPLGQQNVYATLNADRMCFQITSVLGVLEGVVIAGVPWWRQAIIGVTPRTEDGICPSVVGSAGGGGGGGGTVVIPDPINNNTIQLAGNAIDLGAGNVGAGTQLVTIATDDVNLAAINQATADILIDTGNIASDTANILLDTANIDTNIASILADTATIDSNTAIVVTNTGNCATALQIMDDWDAVHDAVAGTDGIRNMGYATASQAVAVSANGDDVRWALSKYGEVYLASHTYATQSDRNEEIDPANQWYEFSTLVTVTNGADGTYLYYIPMASYTRLDMQATISGGSGTCTVTVEASIQADGTAPASMVYQDVTNLAYGAATFTASAMLVDNTQFFGAFNYVKVKVVAATGAANDADWTIYIKKTWE